jgi:glutathione S-transferase
MTGVLRLVTIPISHYCEKARWALDRAGIAYREERHVQLVHRAAARRAGGGRTVPVLVTPEAVLRDSADILRWVDERTPAERRLYPDEPAERTEVERICARLDESLGPPARRLIYVHVLRDRALTLRFNNHGVPRWEDAALRLLWPLATREMRRQLAVSPGIERADEATVWRELDWVAERLADGGGFLSGRRFGAADLTFAALSAAVVVPPVYGTPLPQPELLRPDTAALVERARAHPAGRYAMELFATERRAALYAS